MGRIEDWFASEETGEPFRNCVACRMPLLEIDAPWVVNKDYFRGECVMEYAICQHCRDRLTMEIPEATKAAIRGFLEREVDWAAKFHEFFSSDDDSIRFAHCISCSRPREDLEGFAISGLFDSGGHPVMGPLPLLICKDCYSKMTSLLCEQGRKVWQRFLTEHFEEPHGGDDNLGIL